jgi:hypothetical protein
MKSGGHVPKDVLSWDGFLEKVNKYEFVDPKKHPNPQFVSFNSYVGEMSIQAVFETNIWNPTMTLQEKEQQNLVIRILLVIISTIICSCQ